jgi:hypothetical protein
MACLRNLPIRHANAFEKHSIFEVNGREKLIGKAKDARGMLALLYFAMK